MFFYLAKIGWFVLQPLVAVMVLALAALLARRLRLRRIGTAFLALSALLLVICSLSPLGLLMMAALEDRIPRPDLPENVAGIVVLGGALDTRVARTRGEPELNEAADRMTAAMALSRRYPKAKILFSGGQAAVLEDDIPEAQPAEALLLSLGLPPDRLLLDSRSRDTYENAVYSKELADPKSGETWLLVTSAYHMPRALGCFRRAGFPVVPVPVDYRTPAGQAVWRPSRDAVRNLEKVHFAIREYLGLFAYWIDGRTGALFPGPDPASAG
ncbi:YdcF family protein [Aurantimonas sp. VKM B-3413]|uniref:YdcF family protein n=1 Tax=Aurantimonas sp. VKM B-3413 TaxID=2779401 RepID=UPI001E28CEDD|nr:YdcF family protein [Aurantimonas sp. VKM B-3413]MCB8840443.1 YdcF family protein [Aurantimonas sp. VKM B-3413]